MTSSPWGRSTHANLQRRNCHRNLYNTEYLTVLNQTLLPSPPAQLPNCFLKSPLGEISGMHMSSLFSVMNSVQIINISGKLVLFWSAWEEVSKLYPLLFTLLPSLLIQVQWQKTAWAENTMVGWHTNRAVMTGSLQVSWHLQ